MEVFRLVNKKFAIELSGIGAAITGARWNSKGVEVIYTAQSRALAMAEVAVHLSLATLPKEFCMLTVLIPDIVIIEDLDVNLLQKGWNSFPGNVETQNMGNVFIRNKKAVALKVPSAVVKGDFNYIINPYHQDFDKIKIVNVEDFPFDKRIFN